MTPPPGIEAIDQIEELAESTIAELEKDLDSVQEGLYEDILTLLKALTLARGAGQVIAKTTTNLREAQGLLKLIDELLTKSPAIKRAFAKYFKAFDDSAQLANGFYNTEKSFKALTDLLKQKTADNLLAALRDTPRKALSDTIVSHITQGAPMAKLRQAIKLTLEQKPLAKYAGQIASDSLNQYNRSYLQAITQDLGLKHYFWKGTKIATTRDFPCKQYTGKYLTLEEMQKIAERNWPGKIPGTNASNILVNLGGYNCRHLAVGVTEAVYEARRGK